MFPKVLLGAALIMTLGTAESLFLVNFLVRVQVALLNECGTTGVTLKQIIQLWLKK